MKKLSKFIGKYFEFIMVATIGACILTITIASVVMIIRESDFIKCIEANCVVKAADEHSLMYYCTKTKQIKTTEEGKFYKTQYVGYDEYHTYYSIEYLTATRNYEILQTVEINYLLYSVPQTLYN